MDALVANWLGCSVGAFQVFGISILAMSLVMHFVMGRAMSHSRRSHERRMKELYKSIEGHWAELRAVEKDSARMRKGE